MVISPPQSASKTIAQVFLENDTIKVRFPERLDEFNTLVKKHGFHWQRPLWIRDVSGLALPARERCIELCYNLIDAGFIVDVPDDLVQDVVDCSFEPEQKRWIKRITTDTLHKDWFAIVYPYGDDFYKESRRITGSEYSKPRVVVPKEHYDEVLDFADIHGFKLSKAALKLVELAKSEQDNILVVNLKPRKKRERKQDDNNEILDDLLDKD